MQWLDHAPKGLRLPVTSPLDEVEAAAATAEVIILEFDAFRDGRGFSLASVLRERGFSGQLIADGRLIPDQARHLRRTGFDGVVIGATGDVEAWRRMDGVFSAVYQPAATRELPIWRSRREVAPVVRVPPSDRSVTPRRASAMVTDDFNKRVREDRADNILWVALKDNQGLRPAVLSSFGTESAVLLSLVARIDPTTPIVFIDTGMHFMQTLSYRDLLTRELGLTDIRIATPFRGELESADPTGSLWKADTDACCDVRKVRPLDRALAEIDLVITGRKQHQTGERADMKPFEFFEGRVRANPLMRWSSEQIEERFVAEQLPRHPLSLNGYPSIGCWPCTRQVKANDAPRDGRWSGAAKTECGIHLVRQAQFAG
ncbi:phosphoadenylyl-sulfate reductase [Brevundimonas sp.]|uniref:phosphoadenylyl-sulfate reductase n=1 Tax=Brevundimonas sp. TaxID=1871086 RepID=UPI00286C7413|nr:phosphoadenylyl-sulfate reductase [Brevundimonas sp.]